MDRAERMIKAREPFDSHRNSFVIFTKGPYANDTNFRLDSDVDVVVENYRQTDMTPASHERAHDDLDRLRRF